MKTNISKLKSSITNPNKLNYVAGQSSLSTSTQKRSSYCATNPQLTRNMGMANTLNSPSLQPGQFTSNYQTIFKTVIDEKLNPDKKLLKNYSSQQQQQIHKVGPIKFSRKNHSNSKLIVDQTSIFVNNYENILNRQKQWKSKKSLSFSRNQSEGQYFSSLSPHTTQNAQIEKNQSQVILQWSRNKEQLKKIKYQLQQYRRTSNQSIEKLNQQNQQLKSQLRKQKQQSLKKIVQLELELATAPQKNQPPVVIETQLQLQPISYKELGESFQKKVNDLYDQNYKLKNTISSLSSHVSQLQAKNCSLLSTVSAYQQRQIFQNENSTKGSIKKQVQFLRLQNDKLKDNINMLESQHELAVMKFQNKIQVLKENSYKASCEREMSNFDVTNSIKMGELRILAKDQFSEIIQLKRQKKQLLLKLEKSQNNYN